MLLICFHRSNKCCFSLKCILTNNSYSLYLLFFVLINPLMLPVFTWRILLTPIVVWVTIQKIAQIRNQESFWKTTHPSGWGCLNGHLASHPDSDPRCGTTQHASRFPSCVCILVSPHPTRMCERWKSVATAQQLKTRTLTSGLQLHLWIESWTNVSLGCFSVLATQDSDLKLSGNSLSD